MRLGAGDSSLQNGSSYSPVVVTQHAAESLPTLDVTTALADSFLGLDERVVQPLMISFDVMVSGEFADGTTKRLLFSTCWAARR